MAISTTAEAAAARDRAQHLFHMIEARMGELRVVLIELDAYASPIVDAGSGTVSPMDGTPKPNG